MNELISIAVIAVIAFGFGYIMRRGHSYVPVIEEDMGATQPVQRNLRECVLDAVARKHFVFIERMDAEGNTVLYLCNAETDEKLYRIDVDAFYTTGDGYIIPVKKPVQQERSVKRTRNARSSK